MKKVFKNFDWGIVIGVFLLLTLGLTVIESVASQLFGQQLIYSLLSLLAFFVFSQIDFRFYPKLGKLFYFLSLLGLVLTFIFGAVTRGAVRWVQIGQFTLQPSELVKPFLILAFASFLISKPIKNFSSLVINLFWLLIPVLLIFGQPDLGSSLVVIFFWGAMVLASGVAWRLIIFFGLVLAGLFPLGWWMLQSYQQARIKTFLDPFADPLGSGYNMIQAMIAVGSGRLWGRGLGWGTQSHLRFLPEHHTDFIFASLSEELGFLGGIFLIFVFIFLFWRVLKVAFRSKEGFGFLIGVGVFGMLFFQFFVNLGMNLGLLPITGITLPLVSYGGSSLLASMIGLGMVQNIARLGKRSYSLV